MKRILQQILRQTGICRAGKEDTGPAVNSAGDPPASTGGEDIPAEVVVAIGVALAKYEQHALEMESAVLTINRVARAYSPWSSKIYGITNQLNRK